MKIKISRNAIRRSSTLALLALSAQSFAATYYTEGHKIKYVSTGWGGEGLYVGTDGALPSGADCGGGNRFLLDPDTPLQKEIVSILLIAMQNKTNVRLYIDGCNGNVMRLKAVTITD